MGFDFQRVILNSGDLYQGKSSERPPSTGLPVQGPLEEEMSTSVYRSQDDGQTANISTPELALLRARLRQLQDEIRQARSNFDIHHPVDEYNASPGVPGTNTGWTDGNIVFTSSMEVTRTWDIPERIEGVIVCVPAGCTEAVLKLADRFIPIYNGFVSVPVPGQPAVPPSNVYQQNVNAYAANVTITGGVVTAVSVNGQVVGTGDGMYIVPSGGAIAVTYSVAPAWAWSNATVSTSALPAATLFALPAPVGMILNQDDERVLLMNGTLTAGPTMLELTGFADEIYGCA